MRQKYIRRCDVEAQKEFSLQALVSFEMILIAILSTRGINFRIDQRLKFISRRSHDKAACQGEPNKNSFNLLSMAVFFSVFKFKLFASSASCFAPFANYRFAIHPRTNNALCESQRRRINRQRIISFNHPSISIEQKYRCREETDEKQFESRKL
jgi:hypothetical protein